MTGATVPAPSRVRGAGRWCAVLILTLATAARAGEPVTDIDEPSGEGRVVAAPQGAVASGVPDMPGVLVPVGRTRLHLDCRGEPVSGAVLFEAGLGGNALEWEEVRERLHARLDPRVRTCAYDRAGYGWSDPVSGTRDAVRLAAELDTLLQRAGIRGPLVVVAHSFGGFIARLLIERREGEIAGLVLVDASHERQFERLSVAGGRAMLPGRGPFFLSRPPVPDNLPDSVRPRIVAFSHLRKTYSATHGELAGFALSAAQVRAARTARAAPWHMPLVVVRRGRQLYAKGADDAVGRDKDAGWAELQEDLASLSTRGRAVVATDSGHHVHVDQPALVADVIAQVLGEVRTVADGE